MGITIYADVLTGLNILITYITLVASRIVLKMPTNKYAVAIASVIGGFSSLVIFYEQVSIGFSAIYKMATASLICSIAFLPKSAKSFVKILGVFLGVTFLFGGAMLGLSVLNPDNILYLNGTVYFNMSLSYLAGGVLSIYGVFVILNFILDKRSLKDELCRVKIEYNQNQIEINGFIDSGNNLTDYATGRSVFVAEFSAVLPLFSYEEREFFKNGAYEKIPHSLYKKIRVIPAKTINGEGVLTAFLPDYAEVTIEKCVYKNIYCIIGVTPNRLSNGDYKIILNNKFSETLREEKSYEDSFKG